MQQNHRKKNCRKTVFVFLLAQFIFPHSLPLEPFGRGPGGCFGHTPDMGSLEALAELRAMRWTRYASRSTIFKHRIKPNELRHPFASVFSLDIQTDMLTWWSREAQSNKMLSPPAVPTRSESSVYSFSITGIASKCPLNVCFKHVVLVQQHRQTAVAFLITRVLMSSRNVSSTHPKRASREGAHAECLSSLCLSECLPRHSS